MVLGGFIPMPSLILRPNTPILTSVRLSRLNRKMFWSPFPRLSMVVPAWLEWMTIGWLVVLSKHAPELPKGYELPPTAKYLYPSAIIDNEIVSTPSWLVWSDWSVTNFLELYFQSEWTLLVDLRVKACWGKTSLYAFQFVWSCLPPYSYYILLILDHYMCPDYVRIIVRWCSTPCTEAKETLDSVPI